MSNHLLIALAIAAAPADGAVEPAKRATDEVSFRDYTACGVNSLYVGARLLGSDAGYDQIRTLVNPSEDGSASAERLLDAAKSIGLHPFAIDLPPEHWSKLSAPAIAWTRSRATESVFVGRGVHFLLLVGQRSSRRGDWFYLIDPPDAPAMMRREAFERLATGYFVVLCKSAEERSRLEAELAPYIRGGSSVPITLMSVALAATLLLWSAMVWGGLWRGRRVSTTDASATADEAVS